MINRNAKINLVGIGRVLKFALLNIEVMPINIQIEESDLETLKEFYIKKRVDLYAQANSINAILHQLEQPERLMQTQTKMPPATVRPPMSSYSPEFTWIEKITYYINSKGGNATTSEIIEQFSTLEQIADKDLKKKRIASLSSVLSQNSKEGGLFTRKQNANGASVYSINDKGAKKPQ